MEAGALHIQIGVLIRHQHAATLDHMAHTGNFSVPETQNSSGMLFRIISAKTTGGKRSESHRRPQRYKRGASRGGSGPGQHFHPEKLILGYYDRSRRLVMQTPNVTTLIGQEVLNM